MTRWRPFPYPHFGYDDALLVARWSRLHAGDAEPLPAQPAIRDAWALFHSGEFRPAFDAGLRAGGAGVHVANKAQAVQAQHLEDSEQTRLAMFLDIAERALARCREAPQDASAHYWQAWALGRCAQTVGVEEALSRGLPAQVREALEATLRLQPLHADAHVALAVWHAEMIDTLGPLLARGHGADAQAALALLARGLELHPTGAAVRTEAARALVLLEGERRAAEAEALYREAAGSEPLDAKEWLDVRAAQAEADG